MKTINLDRFLGFLDVPNKPIVGVDISASTIKMVELSQKRNGALVLENYTIEPTPKDVFNDEGIAKLEELSIAIEKAYKRLGAKHKNVAICLPTNNVIIKKLPFPEDLEEDDLEDEVLSEATQMIPFPIEEVNVDWCILGPNLANQEQNDVLICAARKDRITEYLAACEKASISVHIVDIEQFAHQRALETFSSSIPDFDNKVIALVDAGSSILTISVYSEDKSIFNKEVSFGSSQLTESIVQMYGCSPDQAEEAKRQDGEGLDNYYDQVLNPFLESMSMEINRALQFFLTQASVESIDLIILSGGCATFKNVDEVVSNLTQIPTMIINPFADMELGSKLRNKPIEKEAPLLLTATGLALRRFEQ